MSKDEADDFFEFVDLTSAISLDQAHTCIELLGKDVGDSGLFREALDHLAIAERSFPNEVKCYMRLLETV